MNGLANTIETYTVKYYLIYNYIITEILKITGNIKN